MYMQGLLAHIDDEWGDVKEEECIHLLRYIRLDITRPQRSSYDPACIVKRFQMPDGFLGIQ